MQNKKIAHFELLTSAVRGNNIFALTTSDPMSQVTNGYMDRFASMGIRKNDRVMVTANVLGEPELGWLLITRVEKKKVVIKVLNGNGS